MGVAPEEVHGPEEEDGYHLDLAEAPRGPAEDMICGERKISTEETSGGGGTSRSFAPIMARRNRCSGTTVEIA